VKLRAEGMRCHACEQKLSAWLRDIPGVEAVVANHQYGLVTIFARDDTSVDEMLKAVVNADFVPGVPEVVVDDAPGVPAVEMPIAASKSDLREDAEPVAARTAEPVVQTALASQAAPELGIEPEPHAAPELELEPAPQLEPAPEPHATPVSVLAAVEAEVASAQNAGTSFLGGS